MKAGRLLRRVLELRQTDSNVYINFRICRSGSLFQWPYLNMGFAAFARARNPVSQNVQMPVICQPPISQIQKAQNVQRNHNPKLNLIRHLAALVMQFTLAYERTRPPAKQLKEMKRTLWRSPHSQNRRALIAPIEHQRQQTHKRIPRQNSAWRVLIKPC